MRRLIICADGTWNTADMPHPTNVTKLARAIKTVASDGVEQKVYYHMGVGTGAGLDKLFGGAFGYGLDRHIVDCYRFLVRTYEPGDQIFLFGFSRGAYTVRSLAGLIRNSGLLRSSYEDRIQDAFELYRDRGPDAHPNSPQAQDFRRLYAHEVRITCIGVWDTIGSLGIPVTALSRLTRSRYQFHDVTLSGQIENAFHAIAIDERRKAFTPTLWQIDRHAEQRVEQVWFAGVHSNIGGGYADSGLSDITFAWMQAKAESCGLELDSDYIKHTIAPAYTGRLYNSFTLQYYPFGEHVRLIDSYREDRFGNGIDTRETIHPSAVARYRTVADMAKNQYSPANLVQHLTGRPLEHTANRLRCAVAWLAMAVALAWIGIAFVYGPALLASIQQLVATSIDPVTVDAGFSTLSVEAASSLSALELALILRGPLLWAALLALGVAGAVAFLARRLRSMLAQHTSRPLF